MYHDPDTKKINKICKSLIGSKIEISIKLTLSDGTNINKQISNCNILGDIMEEVLYPQINSYISTFKKGPPQASPDFYNNDWEWELKCCKNGKPNFDIGNFSSYISQLGEDLKRKMYKTQYLIFTYNINSNYVEITNFKLCKIWEIIRYDSKYPVSLQNKKGMWYNIRPCSFNDMGNNKKTPDLFIKSICEAINKTPNIINNKQKLIDDIYLQYRQLLSK